MTISQRNVHKTSFTIFVSTSPVSVYLVFCTNTFLRRTADVSFDEKRLKHVSQTSSKPILIKHVAVTKTYGSLGTDHSKAVLLIWFSVFILELLGEMRKIRIIILIIIIRAGTPLVSHSFNFN